ncbi:MAG: hypothetical protein F6K42_22260 [Leptolyngbya sp. SIO1D8]|nr:hypothetical protein [Leptolyngbya sp. SIO1D8]
MTTTLYDPAVDQDPLALGFLAYGQLPVSPVYLSPPSLSATDVYTTVPDLLASATQSASGITLDTDGSVFDGMTGYNPQAFFLFNTLIPTGRTFSADADTGYSGFTNYTIDFDNIDINDIEGSLVLESVNPAFPTLNSNVGFTVAFDLTILQESSADDRAGFSVLVVTNDTSKEIELGFKTDGADRIFAQDTNLVEGEDSSAVSLDLSDTKTYWLSILGDKYSLAADGTEVLSGNLRDYNFDPTTSDPPFPAAANPYETPNLIFFGDNTDQAHAEFTLGEISILPIQVDLTPNADSVLFDYEQYLRYQNLNATVPTDTFGGLPLAQFFDENYYLAKNLNVAAAVNAGFFDSGYEHFVQFGLKEGRNPSILYDEDFYLANNANVEAAVGAGFFSSGLEHFLLFGHQEGRDPSAAFDQSDYLTNNSNVQAAVNAGFFDSAFEHYILFGADENRLPALSLYNEAFYLQNNSNVQNAVDAGFFSDGFEHFVLFGQGEGRAPSSLYNEASYLGQNSTVDAAVNAGFFKSGFEHYEMFGRFEERSVLVVP